MTPVKARYHDGKTSQQREVLIHPDPPGGLRVIGPGVDIRCSLQDVRVSARIGNTPRHLYFADGAQCETDENDAIDALFANVRSQTFGRLLHRWESGFGYVAAALVLTGVALWAGIAYGIPALAKQIAFSLPAATERAIGRDALAGLDNFLLEPTQLKPERQEQLRKLFAGMTAGIDGADGYRLELRASKKIGANALALPSGIVVVTDPLVELAQNDAELTGVLAHEIGHLIQRHSLRRLLQGSATTLLVIAVTGDIGSVASLAAALPTLLVEASYSRDFEREADDFALAYLDRHGIPRSSFADMLQRMEAKRGTAVNVPGYLSTHPATSDRAARAGVPAPGTQRQETK